jgi:RNA polymerase sigma factor (sigma-70 family)
MGTASSDLSAQLFLRTDPWLISQPDRAQFESLRRSHKLRPWSSFGRNPVVFREGSKENATVSNSAALPTIDSTFPERLNRMALEPAGRVPRDLQTLFRSGRIGDLSDGALLERFLAARDEAAFESLVGRHGPMVLRVCLATLTDPTDVDDAFQAVFVILFRQGAAIQSRDSVASWLHGVALRVSARAKVDAARRRKHERKAAEREAMTATQPADDSDRAATALHEEVARLPHRYREAVLLYYFEGQTCDEAARRIGRPVGTVKARLARARGLLKQRLARRGIAVPAVLIAAGAEVTAAPAVPPELASATIRSIARNAEIPARVKVLAQGVIGSMQFQMIELVGACCLLVALGVGAVVAARGTLAPRDEVRGTGRDQASTEKPPIVVRRPPEYDAVRLALVRMLPAAVNTVDPYQVTFALIGLAKAQNAVGDRDSALKTFAEADRVAGTVADLHLRRLAVMRAAVARGQIGDSAPARATLERFVREGAALGAEARYNLMQMVIDSLQQAGFKDDARATLDRELAAVDAIDHEGLRDGGIFRLLHSQLGLGDYDGALRQAARYTGQRSNSRAALLQDIMRYLGATDARPSQEVARRALELSRDITYPYPRAQAQADIAAALARAGDIAGGLTLVREIGKDVDKPFQIIRSSELPRALVEVAREQAKAGAGAAATETLGAARSAVLEGTQKNSLSEWVRRIAEAQVDVGDVAGAKISAAAIETDDVEKTLALAALARGEAKTGDRRAANATLREAHAHAQAIRTPRANVIGDNPAANLYRVYRAIALAEAETGDAKAALATVAGHGNNVWRSPLLADIARIQVRLGDATGALATAASIPDATLRAEAYRLIAEHQARSGNAPAALEWATRLEAPAGRAFALIGITEGIVAREPSTPAQGTPKP